MSEIWSLKNIYGALTLRNLDNTMRALVIIWAILQFVDVSLTIFILNAGGVEINALGRLLFANGGAMALVIMKVVMIIAIFLMSGLIYPFMKDDSKQLVQGVYTGLVLFYAFIAVWNFNEAFKVI